MALFLAWWIFRLPILFIVATMQPRPITAAAPVAASTASGPDCTARISIPWQEDHRLAVCFNEKGVYFVELGAEPDPPPPPRDVPGDFPHRLGAK